MTSESVFSNFQTIIQSTASLESGFILLEHDLKEEAVDLAVDKILPEAVAYSPKLTMEPIITCLGLQMADSYVETAVNGTAPAGVSSAAGSSAASSVGSSASSAVSKGFATKASSAAAKASSSSTTAASGTAANANAAATSVSGADKVGVWGSLAGLLVGGAMAAMA